MGNQASVKLEKAPPPPAPCECHWYDKELPEFATKDAFMDWLKQKLKEVYVSEPNGKREIEIRGRVWTRFAVHTYRIGLNKYDYFPLYDVADAIGHPYTLKAGAGYIKISFVQFPDSSKKVPMNVWGPIFNSETDPRTWIVECETCGKEERNDMPIVKGYKVEPLCSTCGKRAKLLGPIPPKQETTTDS